MLEERIKQLESHPATSTPKASNRNQSKSSQQKSEDELLFGEMLDNSEDIRADGVGLGLPSKANTGLTSETTSSGKAQSLKSGYEVANQLEVVRKVMWPHGFCGKLRNYTNVKPEALSMEAFFYGFLEILLQCMDDDMELSGRISHGKQIMWHTIHHDWESAREFHYQVLRDIEVGNLEWHELHEMQVLSLSTAECSSKKAEVGVKAASTAHAKKEGSKQSSIICYLYNNDSTGCKYERDQGQCKKLHACSTCAAKGFLNRHRAAFDCRK